ncbi:MAG: ABC transporter substrate-binding protein [Armatimonadetes bacterium]|nr:ABC transporter substrate-binding protein [Armatimonadota bacterium]
MSRSLWHRVAAPALLLALAALAAGCGVKKANTIRIGEFASLTGDTATFGISTRNGIELAAQEINAAGGVLGKQVEVLVEDNRSQTTEAATAVTRLINQYGVVAVLGEVASSRSLAGAPICQRNRIPMITPASTNPAVTQVGDYIFRICFIDPFQGTVMARFAFNTLKARKVAVLFDKSQDYSTGLADFFREEFERLGGKITTESSYSSVSGDIDFKAQLTGIRAKAPDAVFVPGYYNQVGMIAKQSREIGITVPLLGGDGWDSPKLVEIGGKALEGDYFSNHYSVENKSPHVQAFITKYRRAYGDAPDAMAALGYDSARILCDAIRRAGSTEAQAIRDAIAQTSGFEGVTGTITLNAERNAVKPAVVLQVKDGRFRYVETVQP